MMIIQFVANLHIRKNRLPYKALSQPVHSNLKTDQLHVDTLVFQERRRPLDDVGFGEKYSD